jgi:hypothetical protein
VPQNIENKQAEKLSPCKILQAKKLGLQSRIQMTYRPISLSNPHFASLGGMGAINQMLTIKASA